MIINGKTFLNTQEAVAWLLQNNALPFQSTANYAPNTEIAKTTIINPSPAEIKVGALVLFSDSKVGTVSGITSNGFIVGPDYTDIKNALAYIVSVALNASNHLITTLSDGTTKDAGLIKEVSSMSINASQHLMVNYNDGTTNDLGAIFSGNVNISGNLTADSIIENMTGYSFTAYSGTHYTFENIYAGCVKTGNKITFVLSGDLTHLDTSDPNPTLGNFYFPASIGSKLIPTSLGTYTLWGGEIILFDGLANPSPITAYIAKYGNTRIDMNLRATNGVMTQNRKYYLRYEITFLLGDNLAS